MPSTLSHQIASGALPVVGHLPMLVSGILRSRGNFAEFLNVTLWKRQCKTMVLRVMSNPLWVTIDPELVRTVLVDRPSDFPKTGWEHRVLSPVMEGGLIILKDEVWKTHRKAISQTLSPALLSSLPGILAAAVDERQRLWPQGIDMEHEMTCIVQTVLARYFMDETTSVDDQFARCCRQVEAGLESRVFNPLRRLGFENRTFSKALRTVHSRVRSAVHQRGLRDGPPSSPLDYLLKALPSPHEVCQELHTIIAAGATTGHLLSWIFLLLAHKPETQTRLRDELRGLTDLSASELDRCDYLTGVIHEGLRLYPPAPYLMRQARANSGECGIAPGSFVLTPIWAMHRHPDYWQDPERFRPERWEELSESHPVFMPFGLGARACIGKRFALMEAKVILARTVTRFEILPDGRPFPRAKVDILTRPKGSAKVRLKRISSESGTKVRPAA